MKKILIGFILGGIVFTLGGVLASTIVSSTNVIYQDKTVGGALDELYNDSSRGKELIASAISKKGITTTSTDTFEVMANNINQISCTLSDLYTEKTYVLQTYTGSPQISATSSIDVSSDFQIASVKSYTNNSIYINSDGSKAGNADVSVSMVGNVLKVTATNANNSRWFRGNVTVIVRGYN